MDMPLKVSALVTGLGAVLNGGAQAASREAANEMSASDAEPRFVAVRLQTAEGRIFLSERGGAFEEIDLGGGPEAAALRRMLESIAPEGGVVAVPVGPEIIARGGASGGWSEPRHRPKKGKLPDAGAQPDPRRDLPEGG